MDKLYPVSFLFDPGHGGLIGGKYQTAGKYSPKFDDGSRLLEGVNNRVNVREYILPYLHSAQQSAYDIVPEDLDISLIERSKRVNEYPLMPINKAFISIHSDADNSEDKWGKAGGISVWTCKKDNISDEFANIMIDGLMQTFGDTVKWRVDESDGDKDKEADFAVLRRVNPEIPAILIEAGFHTNKAEAKRMLTHEWRDKLANGILIGCVSWREYLTNRK